MRVFVLLFNSRTDNEGIHTIRLSDPDTGETRDVVLMFESEDDATRFGILLEAQDLPSPTVEAFDEQEIAAFCQDANYDCRLIPEGTLAMPPETNLEETDWQLEGRVAPSPEQAAEFSESELDRIRRKLEGLL